MIQKETLKEQAIKHILLEKQDLNLHNFDVCHKLVWYLVWKEGH